MNYRHVQKHRLDMIFEQVLSVLLAYRRKLNEPVNYCDAFSDHRLRLWHRSRISTSSGGSGVHRPPLQASVSDSVKIWLFDIFAVFGVEIGLTHSLAGRIDDGRFQAALLVA